MDIASQWDNECPSLFDALLPRSEQADFFKQVADDSLLMLLPSTDYLKPAVIGRISATHCRDQLNLPTRSSQLDFGFKTELRIAYERDYQIPAMYHWKRCNPMV